MIVSKSYSVQGSGNGECPRCGGHVWRETDYISQRMTIIGDCKRKTCPKGPHEHHRQWCHHCGLHWDVEVTEAECST